MYGDILGISVLVGLGFNGLLGVPFTSSNLDGSRVQVAVTKRYIYFKNLGCFYK